MLSKASFAVFVLLAGAASIPTGFATAAESGAVAKAQYVKALEAKKAKQQRLARQRKLAKQQQLAKQSELQKKKWYEDDRDRGLDIAAEFAPTTIARLRKNNTIAKGDTVRTGNGKSGWQHHMEKYYSR